MGQRLIHISQELFKDVLKLPADMEIVGVSQDFFQCRGDLVIKVESPMFSEVKPGSAILYAYHEYSCYRRDCGCYETKLTGWSGEHPTNRESLAAAFGSKAADVVYGKKEEELEPVIVRRGREFI